MSGVAPAAEASAKSSSKPGVIGIVFDFAENTAKALTVFLGTIYVIGYIIIASRLAEYEVPITRLVDAQYLVAGLIPGLMSWFTVFVLVSAFRYDSDKKAEGSSRTLNRVGLTIPILFAVLLIVELAIIPFSRSWSSTVRSPAIISSIAGKFVVGELALWFLIVGWRTKYFSRLNQVLKALGERISGWYPPVVCSMLAALALYLIPDVGWKSYNALPQAYGGGRPLRIELFVDATKVAPELLAEKPGGDQVSTTGTSTTRTVPLNLIMRTSTEYIVDPLEDSSQRAWVIKSDVVHAEYVVGSFP